MRTRVFGIVMLLLCTISVRGNDGIYYVSGNQLIPLQENDIAVQKEILTISLKDDGFAGVDVYYEFFNKGKKKNILMGFEADAPYNSGEKFNHKGIHPDIFDFSVNMNGNALSYSNAVVKRTFNGSSSLTRLDLSKWKHPSEDKKSQEIVPTDEMLYNAELDSIVDFAYSYYFMATFNPGLNIVKHHYRYRLSHDVSCTFNLPYKLTPATRWANHKIDNFSLILRADSTAKHFLVEEGAFAEKPFKLKEGTGKIREHISVYGDQYTEVSLRNGAIIWQKDDFSPQKELRILSADAKIADNMEMKGFKKAQFYDRSDNYPAPLFSGDDKLTPFQKRIVRNLPFAHRGYVFHNPQLKRYFEGLWWYMPDYSYNGATDDFTKHEMELIKNK